MPIDFKQLEEGLCQTIQTALQKNPPHIREYAQRIIEQEQHTLLVLYNLRATGAITEEELRSELEDEIKTIECQILAVKEMTAVTAQHVTNAILHFLGDFIVKTARITL